MHGHILNIRILSARTILGKASLQIDCTCVTECLIGNQTGTTLIIACNQQSTYPILLAPLTLKLP